MLLDNANALMLFALLFNLFSSARFLMCLAFFVISMLCAQFQITGTPLDYATYAWAELAFIVACCKLPNDSVITVMIKISLISLVVQLIGSTLWMMYKPDLIYTKLTELIFALQLAVMFYAGIFRERLPDNDQYNYSSVYSQRVEMLK